MRLFEINQQIRDILDQTDDDGCLPESALDELVGLNQARELKLEAIACIIKEKRATAREMKEEEQQLAKRRKTIENDIDRLENYLDMSLDGEKFETVKAVISYRKSKAVEIDDISVVPEKYIKTEIKPDKVAIANVLKSGEDVPGTHLEERRSIQIR